MLGGPFTSKPTWSSTSRCSATSAFLACGKRPLLFKVLELNLVKEDCKDARRIAGWQNKTLKAGVQVMAKFFYSKGDEQIGPVAGHQLKQLAADGRLVRSGFVWLEGGTKKVSADQCPGLVFKISSEAEPI